MKATIISTGANYTVTLENGQKGLHPQPKADLSEAKYAKLLTKNFGYDFGVNDQVNAQFVVDKIDQVLCTVEDDFDPNLNTIEPSTGEVTPVITAEHPQQPFINPLKPETMETTNNAPKAPKAKAQAKAKPQPAIEAEVIKEPKHSMLAKSRGISARLAETGIRGVGIAGCTFFYGIADLATLSGDLWAQGAAAAIKPLGTHPDATRSEIADTIKLSANKTLATVYTVPLIAYSAITKPKAIVDKAVNKADLQPAV